MSRIFVSGRENYNGKYYMIMEDPNRSMGRIFINGRAHDIQTLTPKIGTDQYWNMTDGGYDRQSGDDYVGWAPMMLEGGTIIPYATGDTQHYDTFMTTTFHKSLDFLNYPAKKAFITDCGKIYWNNIGRSNVNTTDCYSRTFLTPSDCTLEAVYDFGHIYNMPNIWQYEDVNRNRMWGWVTARVEYDYVSVWQPDMGPQTSTSLPTTRVVPTIPLGPYQYRGFFMGVDVAGWPTYCYVNEAANSAYYIYKINPESWSSYAVTTILSNLQPASGIALHNWTKSWPSNIRHVNDRTKVFYSSHFVNQELKPQCIVWDRDSGTVTATACTMVYPSGTTYFNYGHKYGTWVTNSPSWTEGETYLRMSWRNKGWQFTHNGVNYITFIPSELTSTSTWGSIRFASLNRRAWQTYRIESDNTTLTWHSSYRDMPEMIDMVADWISINGAGTQLCYVNVDRRAIFVTFDAQLGWIRSGEYPIRGIRSLGVDSTGRVWAAIKRTLSRGDWPSGTEFGPAYMEYHIVEPQSSITFKVQMAQSSYTYTGTVISTSASVSAYDAHNVRVSIPILLKIDGPSMIFTSTGNQTLTSTTSASADITIPISITSGGLSNIIAQVNY
jgi:hypothetical protein